MSDDKFLTRIAELWIELGGDADGVTWTWLRLRDKVQELMDKVDGETENP